jgi:uncharacterized membrane protein YphA (DoxX/SURF4 family)
MKKNVIVEIIAFLFIILFLYTAISKWMDFVLTREQIGLTPLLAPVATLVTISLPAAEIIASVLLFIPRTRVRGLYATLTLMLLFTSYIIYILNYDDQLPCTCGGIIQQLSWKQHLILNIGLILLALAGILLSRRMQEGNRRYPTSFARS